MTSAPDDAELVAALRRGDERAFVGLVDELSGPLIRLALAHVPSRAIAEEVVQDTWVGVIRGLDRFEGRSSLRTWIFQILLNNARTRGKREQRTLPFSALGRAEEGGDRRSMPTGSRGVAGSTRGTGPGHPPSGTRPRFAWPARMPAG